MNAALNKDFDINSYISNVSIEYKDGQFEVREDAVAVSTHASIEEAQWIKSVLDRENKEELRNLSIVNVCRHDVLSERILLV